MILVTAYLADDTTLEQRFDDRAAATAMARELSGLALEDDQHGVLVLTPTVTRVTVEVEE